MENFLAIKALLNTYDLSPGYMLQLCYNQTRTMSRPTGTDIHPTNWRAWDGKDYNPMLLRCICVMEARSHGDLHIKRLEETTQFDPSCSNPDRLMEIETSNPRYFHSSQPRHSSHRQMHNSGMAQGKTTLSVGLFLHGSSASHMKFGLPVTRTALLVLSDLTTSKLPLVCLHELTASVWLWWRWSLNSDLWGYVILQYKCTNFLAWHTVFGVFHPYSKATRAGSIGTDFTQISFTSNQVC